MGKKKVLGKIYCPKPGCQSGNVLFRIRENKYTCRSCGNKFKDADGLILVPKKVMDCE